MEILCIIKSTEKGTFAFEPSYLTISEVLFNGLTLNDRVVVVLQETIEGVVQAYKVDLLHMLSDNRFKISELTTWDVIVNKLTTSRGLLVAYKTDIMIPPTVLSKIDDHIYENPTVQITTDYVPANVYSVTGSTQLEVGYGSIDYPNTRNIPALRWRLPDLIIDKVDASSTINLSQSLVAVNGIIHCPIMVGTSLYLKGAINNLKSTTGDDNRNLVLIDFSPIGDVEIVPMSECSKAAVTDKEIMLRLPESVTLKDKSVLLVMAGRIFTAPEVRAVNSRTVMIPYYDAVMRPILFENKMIRRELKFNTHLIEDTPDYRDNIFSEWQENFLVIINRPLMFSYTDPRYTFDEFHQSMAEFPVNTGGILINSVTKTIYDYNRIPYLSGTKAVFAPLDNLRVFTRNDPTRLDRPNYGVMNDYYQTPYNQQEISSKRMRLLNFYGVKSS